MRKEFEMSEDQQNDLLEACKPTPVMFLSGGEPMHNSPQENANRAWQKLGEELGFIWDTASPVPNKNSRFFSAEPK